MQTYNCIRNEAKASLDLKLSQCVHACVHINFVCVCVCTVHKCVLMCMNVAANTLTLMLIVQWVYTSLCYLCVEC